MVSTAAATAIRVITAAPGLQPACISDEANAPEVPKVAADSTARVRPARLSAVVTVRPCK
jgi:hypothetical protein